MASLFIAFAIFTVPIMTDNSKIIRSELVMWQKLQLLINGIAKGMIYGNMVNSNGGGVYINALR